jgi:putative copper export protein
VTLVVFLHLLGAAIWVGGLVFLGLAAGVARTAIPEAERIEFFRTLGRRFALLAAGAALLLAITGVALVDDRFGGIGDLGQPGGGLVVAKTAIFAAVVALAGLHFLWLGPRTGRLRRRALAGDAGAGAELRRARPAGAAVQVAMLAGTLAVLYLAADLVS